MRYVKINAIILSIIVSTATIREASGQIPEGWEIIEITNDPNFYDGPPDINDRGQIVFDRALYPDWSTSEIMMFDHGTLTQLTKDSIQDSFARINNLAEVVWFRDHDGDGTADIVKWREGEITVISAAPFPEGPADINDAGQVVWKGYVNGDLEPPQLFVYDGGVITQITDDELWNQQPRINQAGQVVWTRYDFSVSPWTSEIMLWDDQTITQLSNGQGQMQAPDLNDLTEVVWASPQAGVELWKGGITVELLEDGSAPHINNRGDLCVSRWDSEHSNFGMWIVLDGLLLQLTDGSFGGGSSQINGRMEVAFMSGFFPSPNIALFTNPSFIGDLDVDGDVDLVDVAVFQRCFGTDAPFTGECSDADVDDDADVDLADFAVIQGSLTGPR